MVHICPEAYCIGEILPHTLVLPDTFLTFINKGSQTILLNLLFSIQSKKLFHFQLYGQSVGIPAGLSRYHIALHGTVSGNHILDGTGFHMSNMGLSVCSGRSIIKGIGRAFLSAVDTFSENIVLLPKSLYRLFPFHKVQIGRYLLVHILLPFCFLQ